MAVVLDAESLTPQDRMSCAALADGGTFVVRSSVGMPDWSLVADPPARDSLAASMHAAGRAERWSGLSVTEDRVWQAILHGFA